MGAVVSLFWFPMEFYATVTSSWWGSYTTPRAGIMQVTETGWDAESVQQWYVKYTGKYQNDRVFAGDYKLDFSKLNVYNQRCCLLVEERC